MGKRLKHVFARLATGLVLIGVILTLVWIPALEWALAFAIAALAAGGAYEYQALVRNPGRGIEILGEVALAALVAVSGLQGDLYRANQALGFAIMALLVLYLIKGRFTVHAITAGVFGLVYIGWCGAHFLLLHASDGAGPALLTVLLLVVIMNDTGAYGIGSWLGRHKLAPRISPRKTWEGAAGGVGAAVLAIVALYHGRPWLPVDGFPDWHVLGYAAAAAIVAAAAQLGDLTESCLKRDAGVKDSGRLFPGHGGVLDRCDGFLFGAPVLYYILHL